MKHFCLHCGAELEENTYICSTCQHNTYLDSLDDEIVRASAGVLSAINIELNTQWTKYRCGHCGSSGHGFAAEDYNALYDKLSGFSVNQAGRSNDADGADRIVDGTHIQVKYCATPKNTVDAAFGNNGQGEYRYMANNEPQILEVPYDQYEECLHIMEEKINNGQIKNIGKRTAKDIVKKGKCTYPQARNLAKAGNIDSLVFDIKTGSVIALSTLGVSFCVKLSIAAMSCKSLDELKQAIQFSFLEGLQAGTITLSTSVLSSQIIRTQFGRNFVALMQNMSKGSIDSIYGTTAGRKLVHDIASGMWKKTLTGASAKNVAIRLVRVNAVTNTAVFLLTSVPDTYRFLISHSISRPQFIKNLVVNASSITGATIGGILGLRFGTPGALVGSMIGGAIGGLMSKTVINRITKDDSERMQELIKIALLELSNEYVIQSQAEFDAVIHNVQIDKVIDTNLLRAMYTAGHTDNNDAVRVEVAKLALRYQFDVIARQRRKFHMLGNEQLIIDSINDIPVTPTDQMG
ncbi:MAG: hypothetical protein HDR75_01780 [Bacteroides sp.]|nr:hypothetical protein [Bacteroides sp.]